MGTEVSKPVSWLSPVHCFCTSDRLSLSTSLSLEIYKLPQLSHRYPVRFAGHRLLPLETSVD